MHGWPFINPLLNPSDTNNNNRQVANFRRFNACKILQICLLNSKQNIHIGGTGKENLDMERNLFKA
jgi:predicted neuraminidase